MREKYGPAPPPEVIEEEPAELLPTQETACLQGHDGPILAVRFNRTGTYCLTCGKVSMLKTVCYMCCLVDGSVTRNSEHVQSVLGPLVLSDIIYCCHRTAPYAFGTLTEEYISKLMLVMAMTSETSAFLQIIASTYISHMHVPQECCSFSLTEVVLGHGRLASCGGDRSVFSWDVATGRIIRKFRGHDGVANSVSLACAASQLPLTSASVHCYPHALDALCCQLRLPAGSVLTLCSVADCICCK